jgi:hypothetical protein
MNNTSAVACVHTRRAPLPSSDRESIRSHVVLLAYDKHPLRAFVRWPRRGAAARPSTEGAWMNYRARYYPPQVQNTMISREGTQT